MTRGDITRMAREAGFNQILATNAGEDVWIDDGFYVEELKNFAVLVAAAEREACAKVCERLPETFKIVADEFGYKAETPTAENYAAAIRTRSDE